MKEKNKKIMLMVGMLLLLVGISYAYFSGVTTFRGEGEEVRVVTANINDSIVKITGNLEFNDLDILPGHKNISSIKLTATGNAQLLPYNLIWRGSNGLNTPLNYTVYKTGEKIEVSTSCEKKEETLGSNRIFYEECSISNIEKLGNIVSSGTIKANTTNTKEILVENEFITATSEGTNVYYYVVLEYPNLDEEQNADMGEKFSGTVTVEESNAKPDINILAVKVEQEDGTYKDVEDIPQEGYFFDEEKSVCSNDAIPNWNDNKLIIENLTKNGTNCYLYFDKIAKALNTILGNVLVNEESPDFSKIADTDEGIFKAEDDDGTSYYFRGAVENNYVKFANKYWRIIRINGDGTIRIIYDGPGRENGIQLESAHIGWLEFNSGYNNNIGVGFMYERYQVHGIKEKSTILSSTNVAGLETWYKANLASYASEIDTNAGFCGDRTPSTDPKTSNGQGGTGTTKTYYGAQYRLVTNKAPVLTCPEEDFYTLKGANKGNKALEYPIGLISADEVSMAGGVSYTANKSYYLYRGYESWTMSPNTFSSANAAYVMVVSSDGGIAAITAGSSGKVRPVINLKADIQFKYNSETTKGTKDDPYVVDTSN